MYRKIWHNCSQSVAQLNFYTDSDIKIMTLTGFKIGNFLITDEGVRKISPYDKVEIKFVDKDGYTTLARKVLKNIELNKRTIMGLNDKFLNFVVINIGFENFKKIPSLSLGTDEKMEVGLPVATMGYHVNEENLSIKQGIISSFHYSEDGNKYIQIDTSIKTGNAGSPLINVETGSIIGVVGHKLTEMSQSYRELKKIMNNNINLLKKYQGKYNIEDIDPVQVLIANQNQIKYITKEIYRIADMGVGYAVPSMDIANFIKENLIIDEKRPSDNLLYGL
ncbi:MAG: trypsin-like peptidase domain-containing protein [Bacteroidales bacterium]|nr:trypsin-like peptidase domain-containing protein [Bacteroidales bacterium]